LDAAFAEFDGLEAGEAVGDGAEFGVVHVGAAGQLEEAELELFFGEGSDERAGLEVRAGRAGGPVFGFEVLTGLFIFFDAPGGVEAREGGGANLDVEFFGGKAAGVFSIVLFVEVDECLFFVRGKAGEDWVDAAWARYDLGLGFGERGFGRGNCRFEI
jgi:hypothetical protein